VLYLAAVILAFFLAFVLATKRGKTRADYLLVAWLAVIGVHLLCFYIFSTRQYDDYPWLVVVAFPLPLVHGPFLFLYTTSQVSRRGFRFTQLLHFVPVLLSYLLFGEFFLLPADMQLEAVRQEGRGYETHMMVNSLAVYLSGVTYIALALARLMRYKRSIVQCFSNTERINFNWLLYLIIWMVVIWLIVMFVGDSGSVFGAVSVFVIWIAYFGIKQVQVFSQGGKRTNDPDEIAGIPPEPVQPTQSQLPETITNSKYAKSTLSAADADSIHERLTRVMREEQPYKDPELTLDQLAKQLGIHPNYLSQVINTKEQKSFYDLINESRVNEFIRLSSQPQSQQFTLVSLAYDCGFNSKASFNRNFKKHTGVTPSEYRRQQPALA
jgi:AraC-like DNA-binding protein